MNVVFDDLTPVKSDLIKARRITGRLEGNTKMAVGIDPGVNYGITIITGDTVQVFYGKLDGDSTPGMRGIAASELIRTLFTDYWYEKWFAIVEGAAYNAHFGQVGLEEVRFGFFSALMYKYFRAVIVPPASVRKLAFGSAKISAVDLWPTMNQNAADSIGCALAAIEKEY